jgi:putative FmdB family regulatory protein
MPIYGYQCTQCGHEVEVLQSFSDAPLRSCPKCMGPLQKLLYPVGVIFKGSGFYTTDYKGGAGGGKRGSDGAEAKPASESGSADKGEGGKDTKPDAKKASDSAGS